MDGKMDVIENKSKWENISNFVNLEQSDQETTAAGRGGMGEWRGFALEIRHCPRMVGGWG